MTLLGHDTRISASSLMNKLWRGNMELEPGRCSCETQQPGRPGIVTWLDGCEFCIRHSRVEPSLDQSDVHYYAWWPAATITTIVVTITSQMLPLWFLYASWVFHLPSFLAYKLCLVWGNQMGGAPQLLSCPQVECSDHLS
jgi:hypothetical protein